MSVPILVANLRGGNFRWGAVPVSLAVSICLLVAFPNSMLTAQVRCGENCRTAAGCRTCPCNQCRTGNCCGQCKNTSCGAGHCGSGNQVRPDQPTANRLEKGFVPAQPKHVIHEASHKRLLQCGVQCQNCGNWMCPDCGVSCGCPHPLAPIAPPQAMHGGILPQTQGAVQGQGAPLDQGAGQGAGQGQVSPSDQGAAAGTGTPSPGLGAGSADAMGSPGSAGDFGGAAAGGGATAGAAGFDEGGGFAAAGVASTPNMIGDSLSPISSAYVTPSCCFPPFTIASTSPGDQVGRMKITENTSPLPRDRVYMNYSFFHNPPFAAGQGVSRFTPGIEKTFFNQWMSFEVRAPFADTTSSEIVLGQNQRATEFGNMMAALKSYIYRGENLALTGGLAINAPTADDLRFFDGGGTLFATIRNEAVHILPFFGASYVQNCFFTQGFLQVDIDANGNSVQNNLAATVARVQSPNFLYLDFNVGYWLYDNPCACHVTGFAPVAELHYTQSLQDTDVVQTPGFTFDAVRQNISVVNFVVGGMARLGNATNVFVGYATPFGARADRQFDGELRVIFNRAFGPGRR